MRIIKFRICLLFLFLLALSVRAQKLSLDSLLQSQYLTLEEALKNPQKAVRVAISGRKSKYRTRQYLDKLKKLPSLQALAIADYPFFPEVIVELKGLRVLSIDGTLNDKGNIVIPKTIRNLKKLEALQFGRLLYGDVPIFHLSREIGELKKLKILNLDGLHINKVPLNIGDLPHLEEFSYMLSNNQSVPVPSLYKAILRIKKLKRLVLIAPMPHNIYPNITTLTNRIDELADLEGLIIDIKQSNQFPPKICLLKKLQHLRIKFGKLKEIPKAIMQLQELTYLSIGGGDFETFPCVVTKLPKLLDLAIDEGKMKEISGCIGQMTQLQRLSLGYNQITKLPAEISKLQNLKNFDLYQNKLHDLPIVLSKLKALEEVDLRRNWFFVSTEEKILKMFPKSVKVRK